MRLPAAAMLAAMLTAGQAGAQTLSVAEAVAQSRPAAFSDDRDGYANSLIESLMPGRLASWAQAGTATRLAVAQVQLSGDNQPSFAVRVENPEMCDRYGCLTFVFMLVQRAWKPVFQTKARMLAVGPSDPSSRMALLVTGGTVWAWDGSHYDVVE
jgi:hypothetical protein